MGGRALRDAPLTPFGTFFVKEYLGFSAEFLAGLGFWAGIPWAFLYRLGMPPRVLASLYGNPR